MIVLALTVSAAPVVDSVTDKTVDVNSLFDITVASTQADNGSISFDVEASPTASFLTFDPSGNSVRIYGTPSVSHAGTYSIRINASDADSWDTESFTLTVNDIGAQLSISTIKLGDKDQRKSNPDADDVEDQDEYATASFTIENSGTQTITNIQVTSSVAGEGTPSDYDISFTNAPSTLTAGEQVTVTIRARIPEFLDAVDSTGEKISNVVGQVTVVGNSGAVSASKDISMEVENKLEFKDLEVCADSDCEDADDGDTVKEIKPGDDMELQIKVENKFKDNDANDVTIEDVELDVDIDDSDFDVSESEDMGDLDADDEDEIIIKFDVDDEANDGSVTMELVLVGKDEHGARHGEKWSVKLDVDREKHEIRVSELTITPSSLSCSKAGMVQTVEARVRYENIGRSDEDEVSVKVEIAELDIVEVVRDIELDEDDDESRTFRLDIPANAKPGTYNVNANAYYDRDRLTDKEAVVLTVPDCNADVGFEPSGPTQEPSTPSTDIVVQPSTTQPGDTGTTTTSPTTVRKGVRKSSFSMGSSAYVALLVGLIVILLIIGIVLVVALARKGKGGKKQEGFAEYK